MKHLAQWHKSVQKAQLCPTDTRTGTGWLPLGPGLRLCRRSHTQRGRQVGTGGRPSRKGVHAAARDPMLVSPHSHRQGFESFRKTGTCSTQTPAVRPGFTAEGRGRRWHPGRTSPCCAGYPGMAGPPALRGLTVTVTNENGSSIPNSGRCAYTCGQVGGLRTAGPRHPHTQIASAGSVLTLNTKHSEPHPLSYYLKLPWESRASGG